jgi:hypothetical protein
MVPREFTVFYIVVLTENQKHSSSPECLVSMQKVMEGSELELAKVLGGFQIWGRGREAEGPAGLLSTQSGGGGCFVFRALGSWR